MHVDLGRDNLAVGKLCPPGPAQALGTAEMLPTSKAETPHHHLPLNLHRFRFDTGVGAKFPAFCQRRIRKLEFEARIGQKKVLSLLMKSEVLPQS